MKCIIYMILGASLGFFAANYYFDPQEIYERGVVEGYNLQKTHEVYIATMNYQKGWDDSYTTHFKARKVKNGRKK